MKLTRIFQHISIAVMITAFSLTSCDYLDVVPPEPVSYTHLTLPTTNFV